ncbi:MAG: gliding motility-associated C-terminal domain-containing protein, partial [Bacteroidia bacterium]|nr:gliding motility-associated C-terminal domain-containing protein [Bacteroidia bacterium]
GDSTNTIVIDWGSSGTGNVRLTTVSRRGCPGNTIDLSIQIDTLPVAKAGADISFCSADSIQLGASDVPTYSYTWSPTQGLSSSTIADPKISLINTSAITDTTIYILSIVDDLTSCIDADTVQVVVRPYPIPNVGADQSFCEQDTIELGTDSTVGYIYVWNPSTGLDDTSSSKPKLTLTNADSIPDTNFYDVTVTVFNCTAYDTARIITRPLPISDAGNDLVFCSGDGDTLGANSILNYTYLWSPESGLDDKTSAKPIVSLTNSTNSRDTFIYKVTTTLDGCVTSDSSQVIVKHLPNPDAGADLRICPDEQDTIGRDTIAPYLYSWSPSYGLNNTTLDNPLVVISVPDTTVTYIVTTTDTTTGCVDYDTVNVVIKPLPVSNAGPDTTFCSGDTISIGADTTVGYSYVWSPSTGLSDTSSSRPTITLINSDTLPDTVFYIVTTTLEGCSTTDTVRVEIRNLPIADAGSDVGFCTGDSINMGVSAKVGYTYLWMPAEGLSDSSISNPQITLTTPSFPPDTIPYILINTLRGCNSSDTANVVVFPTPNTKEIIGSVSLCPGVTGVKYWVERPPNSTYQWFLEGNGSIVSGPPKDTIITDWTTAGAGKISVIETDSNLCVGDTFHLNLVVNAELEPPLPTGPDTLCDRYIDSVKYNVVFTNGSVYDWFVVGGQFLTGDTTNRVFVKWDGVGSGMIWYEEESVTIDTVCRGVSETLNVVVFKSPTATSITGATEVCEDTSLVTYYIAGLSGSNFTWFVDGDTVANGIDVDTISLRWDTARTYQLSVLEYTPDACSETLIDTITVYKTPRTSSISGDTVICFVAGDEYSYSVTGLDSSVYYWTLIGGTIISQNDTADSLSIRWDSVGVHSISITEVSKDSCVGLPATLSIILNETPLANVIEGNFYLCEQNTNILYKVSGIDSSIYYWDIQGGGSNQIADSNSLSVDWDTAGFYPIAVLEVSTKGCIGDTLDSLVQVNPLPKTSKISGDTGICFVQSNEFVYSVVGFSSSYFHRNVFGGTIMGADSTDSLTIRWDSVGNGNITVVEESVDTCWGDTMSLKVDLWRVSEADTILGTTYLCEKNTGLQYQLNGLDSSIYYWAITGGANLIDDSTNSIKIDWDTLGNYEISVLEVSVNNCKDDTIKLLVRVNPLPLTSSITGDTIICPSFEILHAYNVTGFDSSIYVWTITDAVISAGDSTDSITVKWDSLTTNVQLSVIEISKDTCTNYSVTQNILLDAPLMNMANVGTQESDDAKIEVDWIYIDNDVYPENVFVYRRVKFSNDIWELINTLSSSLEQYVDSAVLTSKNPYEYKVYGLNACGDTLKTVIHNSFLLNGKKDEDMETISVNWNRYYGWESGVDDYELWRKLDKETEYTFYRDMVLDTSVVLTDGYEGFIHCYRLKAKSGINESWSNELCVEFEHLLNPPTAISPNGDEYNETWTIHNIDLYPEARVMIFNRWGGEVYYSVGYDNNFDGTRAGQPLPDGTYYYVIDPQIGSKVYKGYITIIR